MKTVLTNHTLRGAAALLLTLILIAIPQLAPAAENPTQLLQKGLFEEEANHDLKAAIQAYEEVVQQFDRQRRLSATAIFRLGECYRKLGRTNEAARFYQRVLQEFPDQAPLTQPSRKYLAAFNQLPESQKTPPTSTGLPAVVNNPTQLAFLKEEIELLKSEVELSRQQNRAGQADVSDLIQAQQKLLDRQRQLPENASLVRQKALLDEKVALAEQLEQLGAERARSGLIHSVDIVRLQQDLISLKRQRAALDNLPGPTTAGVTRSPFATSEDQEIAKLKAIIQDSPDRINLSATDGMTPLHLAASDGKEKVAQFLLENEAQINARNKSGNTPLHLATQSGHKQLVEILIRSKADIDAENYRSETALHHAADNGYKAIAEMLLGQGANPNSEDIFDGTPLHSAVQRNYMAVAELLIRNKADINVVYQKTPRSSRGSTTANAKKDGTPLTMAVSANNKAMVDLLLKNGADRNLRDVYGESALDTAVRRDLPDMVRHLMQAGVDIHKTATEGVTRGLAPLHHASEFNRTEIAELLIKAGADPNSPITYETSSSRPLGATPLILATQTSSPEMVNLLLKHGADPNIPANNGYRPIHYALGTSPETGILKALLDNKADPDALNPRGETPIMTAIRSTSHEQLKLLIDQGADVNMQAKDTFHSALHYAVEKEDRKAFDMLLAAGINVNLLDNKGQTALQLLRKPNMTSALVTGSRNFSSRNSNVRRPTVGGGRPRPSLPSRASSALKDEFAKDLISRGALQFVPRQDMVYLTRSSANAISQVFYRDPNKLNQVTLYEFLAAINWNKNASLVFPDFANISIIRMNPDTLQMTTNKVNLLEDLDQAGCDGNVPLQWGDVVNIPERVHKLSERWQGLDARVAGKIAGCLKRKVTYVINGEPHEMDLEIRQLESGRVNDQPTGLFFAELKFSIRESLLNSDLLLTSSDLSRVKLERQDPKTGNKMEWTMDLSSKATGYFELWLRDGDVITVPEKKKN